MNLRGNWLFTIALTAGVALRVLAVVSYRPALFYIDTVRYLYNSGGNDPVGYRLPLKVLLAIGNFDAVAIAAHLLGLAMAVTIYLVLVRRAVPRWLAALATVPLLLDAYQIQMEQMILPDVWFEALIVAGAAVLLAGPGPGTRTRTVAAAGLVLGVSATFRQVGEILIVPALLYVVVANWGAWRRVLVRCAVLAAAFAVPILGYLAGSQILVGHFYLSHSGVTTTYGRMAWSADCATLRLPAVERGLCPTPAQRAHGPDWLEHAAGSPIRAYYTGPLSARASQLVSRFNHAVLSQQPLRVLGTYARDVVKLFAVSKVTSPGDTPVRRWQFQEHYPYLAPHATPAQVVPAVRAYGGGVPAVWRAGAAFLRGYQLGGGYTPGPVYGFCVLAGLAGSVLAGAGRSRRGAERLRRGAERAGGAGRLRGGAGRLRGGAGRAGGAERAGASHRCAVGVAETAPMAQRCEEGAPAAGAGETAGTDGIGGANVSRDDREPGWQRAALGCLLFFGAGTSVLALSDLFEFTWRYQLPALVTLPPAAALSIAAFTSWRSWRPGANPGAEHGSDAP